MTRFSPLYFVLPFVANAKYLITVKDIQKCNHVENKIMSLQIEETMHKFDIDNTCIFESVTYPMFIADNEHVVIEEDSKVTHQTLSWGLDRIDQIQLPLDNSFNTNYKGNGVNVYVLDTGLFTQHNDFGGRASHPVDFTGDGLTDIHGHGTHCAGIVGSNTYGVATGANLVGVKVLGDDGGGSISDVIKGIEWAVNNQKNSFGGKSAVLSLSLGGDKSIAMDTAVTNAAKNHIVVVAAGNQNSDACNRSPSSAGGKGNVLTVMSSDSTDNKSSFSNYGTCTDLYAPGSSILSTYTGSNFAVKTLSGTSMATPFVAGVAATLLEKHNFNMSAALTELKDKVVENIINSNPPLTPNRLLHINDETRRPSFMPSTGPPSLFTSPPSFTNPPTTNPTDDDDECEPCDKLDMLIKKIDNLSDLMKPTCVEYNKRSCKKKYSDHCYWDKGMCRNN
jgi:hypothetical protein